MRKLGLFAVGSSIVAAFYVALVNVSCTYGNYTGEGYEAGADGGVDASRVVATKTVDPTKNESIVTPENAFEIDVAPGTFDAPTEITVTRLTDVTLEGNLVVPVFAVSAPREPSLPIQVQFRGNNPNGPGTGRTLVVARAGADGAFKPTAMVGSSTGGSPTVVWGLARQLGTFSLVFQTLSSTNSFTDVTAEGCLAKCCASPNGNNQGNAAAMGDSCFCNSGPNLPCFLRFCPNVAAAIERCVEIGNNGPQPIACTNSAPVPGCSGGPCGYNCSPSGTSVCCINNHAATCAGQGGPSSSCTGIAIRCDLATKCPSGTTCCVFDDEAYCASSCPTGRTWCRTQSDCDGGAGDAGPNKDGGPCVEARGCPHGTCGTPPTACTN